MSNLRLNAGTLSSTCYPSDPQQLYNEMMEKGVAVLPDIDGIIISDSAPDAEDRDKAWIKTSAGAPVYGGNAPAIYFNGAWVVRHPIAPSSSERRLWVGSTTDLQTYDGGASGTVGDASGPMWEVDTAFDGRFPLGVGTIPGSSPSATVAVTGTTDSQSNSGDYKHVLTETEGALGSHTHAFGIVNAGNDDAYFNLGSRTTVSSYTGYYITGSNGNIQAVQTQADLFTSAPNNGAGVTSTGHNNMPPYYGVYFIKRTARKFILVS
jgi:hypothetical protein